MFNTNIWSNYYASRDTPRSRDAKSSGKRSKTTASSEPFEIIRATDHTDKKEDDAPVIVGSGSALLSVASVPRDGSHSVGGHLTVVKESHDEVMGEKKPLESDLSVGSGSRGGSHLVGGLRGGSGPFSMTESRAAAPKRFSVHENGGVYALFFRDSQCFVGLAPSLNMQSCLYWAALLIGLTEEAIRRFDDTALQLLLKRDEKPKYALERLKGDRGQEIISWLEATADGKALVPTFESALNNVVGGAHMEGILARRVGLDGITEYSPLQNYTDVPPMIVSLVDGRMRHAVVPRRIYFRTGFFGEARSLDGGEARIDVDYVESFTKMAVNLSNGRDIVGFPCVFNTLTISHVKDCLPEFEEFTVWRQVYGTVDHNITVIGQEVIKEGVKDKNLVIKLDGKNRLADVDFTFTAAPKPRRLGELEKIHFNFQQDRPVRRTEEDKARIEKENFFELGRLVKGARSEGVKNYVRAVDQGPSKLFISQADHPLILEKTPVMWHLAIKSGFTSNQDGTPEDHKKAKNEFFKRCWDQRAQTKETIEGLTGLRLREYSYNEYLEHWEGVVKAKMERIGNTFELIEKAVELKPADRETLEKEYRSQIQKLYQEIHMINTLRGTKIRSKSNHHQSFTFTFSQTQRSYKIENVNLKFKYGPGGRHELMKIPEFAYAFKSESAEKHSTEIYCHPFLRSSSDYLRTLAWVNVLNGGMPKILDVGSKYHRFIPEMINSVVDKKREFTLLRPNLMPYDIVYNTKHEGVLRNLVQTPNFGMWFNGTKPAIYHSDKNPLVQFNLVLDEKGVVDEDVMYGGDILAIDCFYYKGVQDFVKKNLHRHVGTSAHVVAFTVPCEEGTYMSYDAEGVAKVVKQVDNLTGTGYYQMIFNPKGNTTGAYINEVLAWDVQNPKDMYEKYADGTIHYKLHKSIKLGPHMTMFYYQLTYFRNIIHEIPKIDYGLARAQNNYNVQYASYLTPYLASKQTAGAAFWTKPRNDAIGLLMNYLTVMISDQRLPQPEFDEMYTTANLCYDYAYEVMIKDKELKGAIMFDNEFVPNGKDFKNNLKKKYFDLGNDHVLRDDGNLGIISNVVNGVKTTVKEVVRDVKRTLEDHDWIDGNTDPRKVVEVRRTRKQRVDVVTVNRGWEEEDTLPHNHYLQLNPKQKEMLPMNQPRENAGLAAAGFEDFWHDKEDPTATERFVGKTDFGVENGMYFKKTIKVPKTAAGLDLAYTSLLEAIEAAKRADFHSSVVERIEQQKVKLKHTGLRFASARDAVPYVFPVNTDNAVYAVFCRQMGHRHKPDPVVVSDFKKFAGEEIDRRIKLTGWAPKRMSFEEYLVNVPASKKEAYRRGYEKFMETAKIDTTMTFFQKSNEMHYDTKSAKPRSIANPSDEAKAIGAWINACYLANIKELFPEITVGFNSGEVADLIQENLHAILDHQIITWDGSQHDSHQFSELLNGCDGKLLRATLGPLLSDLGIPGSHVGAIKKSLIETLAPFRLMHQVGAGSSKIARRIFQGYIDGTVFSGHATRTTLGNSIRVVLYGCYIMHKASIPRKAYKLMVAGDDVVLILQRRYLSIFKTEFDKVYINGNAPGFDIKTDVTHGLGQVSKDYCDIGTHADFLSKNIIVHQKQVLFNRKITRAIQSGNYCEKIFAGYLKEHHNQNITEQLNSWGSTWPGVREYIDYRIKTLKHLPIGEKEKAKFARYSQIKYYEVRFAEKIHKNKYRTSEEESDLVNAALGGVPYLLGNNIESAPQYLHLLKGK